MKRYIVGLFFLGLILSPFFPKAALARSEDIICAVYFTGVGCPHCAETDPILLVELLQEHPNLIIIEYEIYQQQENASLLYEYNDLYGSGLGIPLIVFSKEAYFVGDTPILRNIEEALEEQVGNPCPLVDGSAAAFNELDLSSLLGKPKIWAKERILINSGGKVDNALLKGLLTAEDIPQALEGEELEVVDPQPVLLSGGKVEFEHAVKVSGWIFEWGFPTSDSGDSEIPWGMVGAVLLVTILGAGILYLALRGMGKQR